VIPVALTEAGEPFADLTFKNFLPGSGHDWQYAVLPLSQRPRVERQKFQMLPRPPKIVPQIEAEDFNGVGF